MPKFFFLFIWGLFLLALRRQWLAGSRFVLGEVRKGLKKEFSTQFFGDYNLFVLSKRFKYKFLSQHLSCLSDNYNKDIAKMASTRKCKDKSRKWGRFCYDGSPIFWWLITLIQLHFFIITLSWNAKSFSYWRTTIPRTQWRACELLF